MQNKALLAKCMRVGFNCRCPRFSFLMLCLIYINQSRPRKVHSEMVSDPCWSYSVLDLYGMDSWMDFIKCDVMECVVFSYFCIFHIFIFRIFCSRNQSGTGVYPRVLGPPPGQRGVPSAPGLLPPCRGRTSPVLWWTPCYIEVTSVSAGQGRSFQASCMQV